MSASIHRCCLQPVSCFSKTSCRAATCCADWKWTRMKVRSLTGLTGCIGMVLAAAIFGARKFWKWAGTSLKCTACNQNRPPPQLLSHSSCQCLPSLGPHFALYVANGLWVSFPSLLIHTLVSPIDQHSFCPLSPSTLPPVSSQQDPLPLPVQDISSHFKERNKIMLTL